MFCKSKIVNILGVVEIREDAPGVKLAKELSIPTASDFREFLDKEELDEIINVTGNEKVQEELLKCTPPNIEILSGRGTKLMWNIVQDIEKSKEILEVILGKKKLGEILREEKLVSEEEVKRVLEEQEGKG